MLAIIQTNYVLVVIAFTILAAIALTGKIQTLEKLTAVSVIGFLASALAGWL